MLVAIIGIALFLVLVLMAVGIGIKKEMPQEEVIQDPILHGSGIYSILKKSPREAIDRTKPAEQEIRKYLSSQIVDIKVRLSPKEKDELIRKWNETINQSIETIEQGDKTGVEFYFYEFSPGECPVCGNFLSRGKFVTREEIFRYPEILPPFHLGCTCVIFPHHGKENLRDTTELGMLPLFKESTPPPLPDWKTINFIHVLRGASA